jgi:hypothetical protein
MDAREDLEAQGQEVGMENLESTETACGKGGRSHEARK